MQDKIESLKRILKQDPPDGKLLQMQLQGGIATAVNQVSCSFMCSSYEYEHYCISDMFFFFLCVGFLFVCLIFLCMFSFLSRVHMQ